MFRTIGYLMILAAVSACPLPAAIALPLAAPPIIVAPAQFPVPVNGLLCGRSWHWSYAYLKCERNRHRCPAGKHWISLLRTCVGF